MIYFLFFLMLFCHLIADYNLQGILASMKQKKWQGHVHKDDYKIALVEHAFEWTFMIMLPIMIFMIDYKCIWIIFYCIFFIINWGIYTIIDDLKANEKMLNLFEDQIIHIGQITVTWGMFFWYIKSCFPNLV